MIYAWLSKIVVVRVMGIALLIPGLLRVPLPQADFHNIRHHDRSGEICPYHDHLLRWHPTADKNDDVAIVHWHWFVPLSERPDDSDDEEGQGNPPPPPSLHAHLADLLEPDLKGDPVIRPDARYRWLPQSSSGSSPNLACLSFLPTDIGEIPGLSEVFAWWTTGTVRARPIALFQRWNC